MRLSTFTSETLTGNRRSGTQWSTNPKYRQLSKPLFDHLGMLPPRPLPHRACTPTRSNQQHKEPKLDMAKRVISGPLFEESWVELDAEVRASEDSRLAREA